MRRLLVVGAWLLCLTACKNPVPGVADTAGTAYIAPTSVNLRGDISQKNTVAVLTHGERVQVLDQKRRFVQIRAGSGATGWVDAFQLLTPEQMSELQKERMYALTLPSEGTASVFDPLNVHLEPSRLSPSFTQIPEGGTVQVLQYKLTPRVTATPKPPVFTIDRPQPERKRKKDTKPAFRLPPKPAPPGLPRNYDELSSSQVEPAKPTQPVVPEKPPTLEEWTLVRTKNNLTGWVLSRNLYMSIPDEVAQYAEGKRITSYFSLGEVKDEESGTVKHNWLWTTLSGPAAYDFDGWRVFIWNRRHHRFETSYRQRDVEGYFPVQVAGNQFFLITKDDDGKMRRRTYNFDGTLVHLAGAEEYHAQSSAADNSGGKGPAATTKPSLWQRLWNKLRAKT